MTQTDLEQQRGGMLAWMVHNRVTPNILMLVLLIGGFVYTNKIKKEVFPSFDADSVSIVVPYPGASPEEVEQGIVLVAEEAVRAVEGIKEINGYANEGVGRVSVELLEGIDAQLVYQNIKQEVDRITTFPEDAERPVVALDTRRRNVLQLQIYGEVGEAVLRETAEQVREALLLDPGISQVELVGARDYEIAIEVSELSLRKYGLTLQAISSAITGSAVEIPGGKVETASGEILVRVKQRKDWAHDFAQIPVLTSAAGSVLRLGEIATVREAFEDTESRAYYNGKPAVGLGVSRIGDQTPIGVSERVYAAMSQIGESLPHGIDWTVSSDRSDIYRQRMMLLLKNAFLGLILVLGVLGIFLEFKLAFWVTMGIPISFLGAFLFLPAMGVTLNIISMFAFIIALGIVVDDAIVAGENIYEYRQRGMNFVQAAIQGAKDVMMPITFAIITNCIAFMPLAFVPGFIGRIWGVVPLVVGTVFVISWVESLLILPCHLAHSEQSKGTAFSRWFHRVQQRISNGIRHFIYEVYQPFLRVLMRWRYVLVTVSVVILLITFTWIKTGRISMIFMPRVESDYSVVTATLPLGSPASLLEPVREQIESASRRVSERNGADALVEGMFTSIDDNTIMVYTYLTDPELRPMSTGAFTREWRQEVGEIIGLESSRFESDRGGPGSGAAISIELAHSNSATLELAAASLAASLGQFPQVTETDEGYVAGKRQFDIALTDNGRALGFTARELASQVRDAFQGAQAMRQQRGRNEVTVRLRRPLTERMYEADIPLLMVRAPNGTEVPLRDVAEIKRGRAYTAIERSEGRRTLTVTADVEPIGATAKILDEVETTILPELRANYLGLSAAYGGRQQSRKESTDALFFGLLAALACIYVILVIPFRSYLQPMIVMLVIPYGVVGAVLGHILMGYNISVISFIHVWSK